MRATLLSLTVLLLPCTGQAADQEPIGRLFSTPAERARLDKYRQLGEESKPLKDQPAAEQRRVPEQVREQITLDGFVRRSSGKNTAWINQMPQNELETSHGVTVSQKLSKKPTISISLSSGTQLSLKPGQTFDKTTGKVSEVYEPAPAVTVEKQAEKPLKNKLVQRNSDGEMHRRMQYAGTANRVTPLAAFFDHTTLVDAGTQTSLVQY